MVHNCENLWSGIISPKRAQHILYGDTIDNPQQIPGVWGHIFPGNLPNKTPFPAGWNENQILNNVADIATHDKTQWYSPNGQAQLYTKNGDPQRWIAWETRDGVQIRVVYEPATSSVITAFPDPKGPNSGVKPIK